MARVILNQFHKDQLENPGPELLGRIASHAFWKGRITDTASLAYVNGGNGPDAPERLLLVCYHRDYGFYFHLHCGRWRNGSPSATANG